ncbi:MAG: nuclear transport factor 2 family protein [Pelagibacterales bacterium]|nr:nuclear transport factor 2 family protein [Pelagibacterales bacterium]
MTENEKRNLLIITEVCDSFNRHDIEGILSRFTEDAHWLTSRGDTPEGCRFTGKKEIRKMLNKRFSLIPNMSWFIHSHWVSGKRGCSEWTVTGNELNGNQLNWLGCDLWSLREDGMIIGKDTYWKYAGGE